MFIGLGLGLTRPASGGTVTPQVITYAPTFTDVAAQPVFAGQAPSAAFPSGVEATANYQSSAGTISTAARQVSINGGAWTSTLTGALDPADTVAIRVRVVDSAANERFFPGASGSGTVAQALPVPTLATSPAVTTTGKIGASQSRTEAAWNSIPGTPAGMARETEGRWTVVGSSVSTSANYTPTEAQDTQALRWENRARHTLNGKASDWTAWQQSAAVTITYNAPTAGSLSNVTYTQGTGNQTVNAAAAFTVTGDADLSGVTWVLTAAPSGVTINSAGVVTIPTGTLLSAQTVTVRAANSGAPSGVTVSFTVTVEVAPILSLIEVSGTLVGDGTGTLTWRVTAPSYYAGDWTFNTGDLATGPVNLVPAQIALLTDADSSTDISEGDTVGIGTPGATSYPGLWTWDTQQATPVRTVQWRVGGVAISGATSDTRVIGAGEEGDILTILETLTQDANVRSASSNAIAVAGGSSGITVSAATDGITFTSTNPLTVTAATDGITLTEA